MLATGIKSPVGVKVAGADLATIDRITGEIERALKYVPGVSSALAERLGGMITAPLLSMFVIPAAYLLMRRPRVSKQAFAPRWKFWESRREPI